MSSHSWRAVESKVSDLRSETFDNIAEIILTLEERIDELESEKEALQETISELEAAA